MTLPGRKSSSSRKEIVRRSSSATIVTGTSPKTSAEMFFSFPICLSPSSVHILISWRILQADQAFLFELARHRNDLLLRRIHVFQLYRTKAGDILGQHLAAALRLARNKFLPQRIAGPF